MKKIILLSALFCAAPGLAHAVNCQTFSNQLNFDGQSIYGEQARAQAINACLSSTNSADCAANVACDDAYANPVLACSTYSNNLDFSYESRDLSLATQVAIQICQRDPHTNNNECAGHVQCVGDENVPQCATFSNNQNFNVPGFDVNQDLEQVVQLCQRDAHTNNNECATNVSCSGGEPMMECSDYSNGLNFRLLGADTNTLSANVVQMCQQNPRTNNNECAQTITCRPTRPSANSFPGGEHGERPRPRPQPRPFPEFPRPFPGGEHRNEPPHGPFPTEHRPESPRGPVNPPEHRPESPRGPIAPPVHAEPPRGPIAPPEHRPEPPRGPIAPPEHRPEPPRGPVAPPVHVDPPRGPIAPPVRNPAPVAPAPVHAPAPVAPAPVHAPAPVAPAPVHAPAPVAPAPVTPAPVHAPAPVTPAPVHAPAPVAPAPVHAPAPVVPAPVTPAPVRTPPADGGNSGARPAPGSHAVH